MDKYIYFKRCHEYYQVEPSFRELMKSNPKQAVEMTGFGEMIDADLAAEALDILYSGDFNSERAGNNGYIQSFVKINQKANSFVAGQRSKDRYAGKELFDYASVIKNRCFMECEILSKHPNIYYFPICYELSKGCRVQCDFCGLAAEKFCGNFEYNEENRQLFLDVLKVSGKIIGNAADTGPLYFATEPMDNPDYENFIRDYISVFGNAPQTTTAVADVYPERIRKLMDILGEERMKNQVPLRFSIRSISQFEKIMKLYSPEELAFVELLPNNRESIAGYSDSGRVRSQEGDPERSRIRYSICCVSGIKVNLPEKSISYIEPEVPDEEYPTGVRVLEKVYFKDIRDYEETVTRMYSEYAKSELPMDRALQFNKHIKILPQERLIHFEGEGKGINIGGGFIVNRAIERIMEEKISFNELSGKLGLFGDMNMSLYNILNVLYKHGFVRI